MLRAAIVAVFLSIALTTSARAMEGLVLVSGGGLDIHLGYRPGPDLKCDGDSADATITVKTRTGEPVPGHHLTVLHGVDGVTDKHGVLHTVITPPAGTMTKFGVMIRDMDSSSFTLYRYPCPLVSGPYSLTVHLIKNGHPVRKRDVKIGYFGCCDFGQIPWHTVQTDANGLNSASLRLGR